MEALAKKNYRFSNNVSSVYWTQLNDALTSQGQPRFIDVEIKQVGRLGQGKG